jgi:hypothetical protein
LERKERKEKDVGPGVTETFNGRIEVGDAYFRASVVTQDQIVCMTESSTILNTFKEIEVGGSLVYSYHG